MEQQVYLRMGGNICPNCDGDNITAERLQADGDVAWGNVSCTDCEATWVDQFKLIGFSELTDPK